MTMHEKIQLRTPSHGDPLAAEARQLAIRAKRTSAYATDGSFRSSVNQVLAQTQHIADQAIDELLVELSERDTKKEEPPPPAAINAADKGFYISERAALIATWVIVAILIGVAIATWHSGAK